MNRLDQMVNELFSMCNEMGADQINITLRNDQDKPIACLICTLDQDLANKLQEVIKEHESQETIKQKEGLQKC